MVNMEEWWSIRAFAQHYGHWQHDKVAMQSRRLRKSYRRSRLEWHLLGLSNFVNSTWHCRVTCLKVAYNQEHAPKA
jgi:hypothetical protein